MAEGVSSLVNLPITDGHQVLCQPANFKLDKLAQRLATVGGHRWQQCFGSTAAAAVNTSEI
jgi:hypothetical protein